MKRERRKFPKAPAIPRCPNTSFSRIAIHVQSFIPRSPLSKAKIEQAARLVLRSQRIRSAHVSIVIADRVRMRRLNKRFCSVDAPTDVLSFNLTSGLTKKGFLWADVVVCVDVARGNARRYGCSVRQELTRYIIHGILHAAGHEDATAPAKKRMWRRQEDLLARLRRVL